MDIISAYIEYKAETEPPIVYHRWTVMSCIAALLGRRMKIAFGSGHKYPNMYIMLIGGVGTRKSTAIKDGAKLIRMAGYNTFSARKTSKEKFLMDLEGQLDESQQGVTFIDNDTDITQLNLFGGLSPTNTSGMDPKEVFISADEFNEFTVGDKIDFYSMLGDLWDWDVPEAFYTSRVKGSKTGGVSIFQPTINILGGNTPENFARAFPPEIIGQGFMSRMLIILGEPSGRKYHMPPVPNAEDTDVIVSALKSILTRDYGIVSFTVGADNLLERLYKEWIPLDDIRFRNYGTRRYDQLLKLCMVHMAAWDRDKIDEEIVFYSNTILSAAERNMPKALGEFGKNKDSDVVNTILTMIYESSVPVSGPTIWKAVRNDLRSPNEATQILQNLKSADKIQHIPQKGYLPLIIKRDVEKYTDWNLLTQEEREML